MKGRIESDLDSPTAVEIEINAACNLRCSYCPNSITKRTQQGFMGEELFKKILSQLAELNFSGRVSYDFYNEPLLHPQLTYFVTLTKSWLPQSKIVLYTNGTLLHEPLYNELCDAGVTLFIITKHEGIKTLPVESFHSRIPTNINFRHHSEMNKFNRAGLLPIGGPIKALSPCYIPSFLVSIGVTGDVLPCFEDYHQSQIMGNITQTHLREIWEGNKFITFRKLLRQGLRHKHDLCRDCNRTEVFPGEYDSGENPS